MERVDQSRPPVGKVHYLLPAPRWFVNVRTPQKQAIFFENWLRLRVPLLATLESSSEKFHPLKSQEWRDYLAGSGGQVRDLNSGTWTAAQKASAQRAIEEIFRAQEVENLQFSWARPLKFCDTTFESAAQITDDDRREILWEIFEIGFHIELTHMDRKLCPGRALTAVSQEALEIVRREMLSLTCSYDLPPFRCRYVPDYLSPTGWSSSHISNRASTLEAFRRLLSRWPGVPDTIKHQQPVTGTGVSVATLSAVEEEMALFYVQTFWEHTGRPPLVPHFVPSVLE